MGIIRMNVRIEEDLKAMLEKAVYYTAILKRKKTMAEIINESLRETLPKYLDELESEVSK